MLADTMGYNPDLARTTEYCGREIQLYGKNAVAFDGMTTNKQDYIQHALEPRPHYDGTSRHTGSLLPFDGQTTYNSQYVAHQIPERPSPPGHQYHGTGAPFDGTTTYKSNYVPHPMERASGGPRGPVERVHLPFDGTTSYRNDFVPLPLPERAVAAGGPYMPAHVPFDGASTYKGDFVPHQFEPRPVATGMMTQRPQLPFDGTTTYGETFRPYPIQMNPACRPVGEYKTSGAKFEGTSESADKYRAWAIDPANRGAHGPPPMRPSLPFDGTTTNREMFKGWQLPPKRPALGVQMVGDLAYVLVPANAPIPAVGRQVFTTVHDGQREMRILVLEGDFSQASRCSVLGHFDLHGLPPAPKGTLKVEVSFHVDQNGVLNVSASDLDTHRQEQWLREGNFVAHLTGY